MFQIIRLLMNFLRYLGVLGVQYVRLLDVWRQEFLGEEIIIICLLVLIVQYAIFNSTINIRLDTKIS